MSLYNINNNKLEHIKKIEFELEEDLQKLTEGNLEELFNLTFVDSEFQVDDFKIDTLAFNNETKSFVIIEYKKGKNYSVIDQGYSYLSVLLNNKAEFVLKYNQKFNTNYGKGDIDFSQSVVMFIAPSFTTYQLKSIEFNDLAFELWEVSKFSNGTILYNPINVSDNKASITEVKSHPDIDKEIKKYTIDDVFNNTYKNQRSLFEALVERLKSEYDDLVLKPTKIYINFTVDNKNIISIEPHATKLKIWINLNKNELYDPEYRIVDVSNKGHHGVGNCEISIMSDNDFHWFLKLFEQAYYKIT